MSRNKERAGAREQAESAPPALAHNTNNEGFSFVVPTEFVELPSKGKFYPEGHPLHGEESIEVKQMTAKEEDLLTSRTLLKKGVAVDRVIKSLVVDKRIDPDTLLVGDRNALLIAIRVSAYGSEYETKIACPACNATQRYAFDLNSAKVYEGGDLSDLDVFDTGNATFTTKLPKTKLDVEFRLLNGRDERNLLMGMKSDRKQNVHERTVTRQLKNYIVSVNGNTTNEAIDYVIKNIPSMDSRHLRLAYKLAAPNVDLTQYFVCSECDHDQDLEVPLTADFFWPDR